MQGLFLYCRAGFESECAAEIHYHSALLTISGYAKTKPASGYVLFIAHQGEEIDRLVRELPFERLIFTRQWFIVLALRNDLSITDRISGLVEGLAELPERAGELFLETPDTNDAKQLSPLCRALERPLRDALRQRGLLTAPQKSAWRIHISFLSTCAAYIGYVPVNNSAPWPMGIVRLRSPRAAPSRSTLKLEEAFVTLLTEVERGLYLNSGMTAVDLGAAPGGWSWQLIQRSMRVTAVDNGPMAESVMESGIVDHQRVDAFRYQPPKPVDWLVCDVVEQPIRIAALIAKWLTSGWCRYTIFNLKLPMKKRYAEVQRCLELISQQLTAAGLPFTVKAKQLYHDREEVTVFIAITE